MKSFISSLTAMFMAATIIGCGETAPPPVTEEDPTADAMHQAAMAGEAMGAGHEAEGEAAPAEGEGEAAPAEGEGEAAPAEGEGEAAPAEEKAE